jgi:hypothetical protein
MGVHYQVAIGHLLRHPLDYSVIAYAGDIVGSTAANVLAQANPDHDLIPAHAYDAANPEVSSATPAP